ncbi:MAG: hypothetical protein NWF07_08700 [Candidatus Bathyarchaeota archaeon]|nr:hypothetical protein [Candidatus Bathyarchaeota archaeon]
MSRVNQTIVLTAILLIAITVTAFYIHETDPETIEERKINQIQQEIEIPETATYLGKRAYNISDYIITVYTWKNQNTLYDAQFFPDGTIKTNTYELEKREENCTISPYTAETIALFNLENETEYYQGHEMLTSPTFYYYENYFQKGPLWVVDWGLVKDDYPIMGSYFEVRVYMDTGEVYSVKNHFDIGELLPVEPPQITELEAISIAQEAFKQSMNYTVVLRTESRGLKLSPGNPIMDLAPNRLYWGISVTGVGVDRGYMAHCTTGYTIDAINGTVNGGVTVGGGVIWSHGVYPYYGLAYPKTVERYTFETLFRVNASEAKHLIFNHSLIGLKGLAWEGIYLEDGDNASVVTSYWARAYKRIKTGSLIEVEGARSILESIQVLDGLLMIIDAESGALISSQNFTNVGPPINTLNITRDKAINITATSPLADPDDKIIEPDTLVLAEPRIIKPDWVNQLAYSGSIRRLYIADVNQTDSRIYWVIRYEKSPEVHGGFTGTYLVDAETGVLSLALEDYPLAQMLLRGSAPDQVKANVSSVVAFNVNVTAVETLEAQLPVSIKAELVPENVTVIIDNSVKQLSGEKKAVFKVTAIVGEEAESGVYNIRFEISFPGRSTSTYTELEIKNPTSSLQVYPRKQVFSLGETIAFDIDSPTQHIGAYIRINNPENYTIWVTDPFTEWSLIDESWRVPYFCQLSEGNPMILLEEALTGNWTWIYRDQNTTIKGGFTVKEPQDGPFSEVTEMRNPPTIHEDITNLALLAEKAARSAQEAVQMEDETGPGPAVPRDDEESSSMWVPFITIVVVFGVVLLKKNGSK